MDNRDRKALEIRLVRIRGSLRSWINRASYMISIFLVSEGFQRLRKRGDRNLSAFRRNLDGPKIRWTATARCLTRRICQSSRGSRRRAAIVFSVFPLRNFDIRLENFKCSTFLCISKNYPRISFVEFHFALIEEFSFFFFPFPSLFY